MTNYILSIDPGVSTGLSLIAYDDTSVPELVHADQFPGGAMGLFRWLDRCWRGDTWDHYNDEPMSRGLYSHTLNVPDRLDVNPMWDYTYDSEEDGYDEVEVPPNLTVIAEKFTARNTRGFSYTTASLEPLRGEGVLLALGLMPDYEPKEKRWRDPGAQYLVGGKDLPNKKARQHKFLKDSGFYRTNKDFPDSPSKDKADDFRSSAAHGLAYLSRVEKHAPTIKLIQDWSEANATG